MIKSLLRKLVFSAVLINGRRTRVHPDLMHYFNVRQNNPVEPTLYSFLEKVLKPGEVFIDVGANAGFISLLVSDKVGSSGKVFVIEPNPKVAFYAHYALSNNTKFSNYVMMQMACSDAPSILPISVSLADSLLQERASLVYREEKTREVDVLCSTIDNILPTSLKPTWIKIDVEGAELSVLNGALVTLRNHRPLISLEVHGLYFPDPRAHVKSLFDFFTTLNYSAVNVMTAKEVTLDEFMSDSGVPSVDPVTGGKMNDKGYGNLILVPEKGLVPSIISMLK
jgi:FkbM family methyltransferase